MAKMRVHELAKELDIKSTDIIETLNGTDYEVKSASSGVDDAAQDIVRKKYAKTSAAPSKTEEPKAEASKTEAPKAEAPKAAEEAPKKNIFRTPAPNSDDRRPKKKSSISAVYNAQYSKDRKPRPGQGKDGQRREDGQRGDNRQPRREGAQPQSKQQESRGIIKPRPVGERAMRPISERTAGNNDEFLKPATEAEQVVEERAPRNNEQRSNDRNNDRNREGQNRGDRAPRRDNEQRNNRDNREQRNDRNQNGKSNDRNNDRSFNRNDRNNDRNNEQRSNDRNNVRNDRNNDRNNDRRSDRNQSAAAPVAEGNGKNNARKDNRNKTGNRNNDHDKLGKRQENYVNLEKHGGKKRPQQPAPQPKEDPDEIKTVTLPERIVIRDFADKLKLQPSAIVKKLFMKGQMVTVNHEIDFETAEEIALEYNYICEPEEKVDVIAELLKEEDENEETMVSRPPVVCVMGHVDHGKTSLLDAIRETRVTAREAGGITQHIGASVVSINNQNITFLDTPGHEAFTAMRMRGANSTDIAILVVAADDGVMPQTVEAINHARAAGVEIIVAINKIDKPAANIDKVKQELSEYQLIPEDWGGSTIFCPVSAHTKEGIDNLLEMVLLTADIMELKANPNRNARGLVIEAQLDKGRGAVATVLVQKGTLHVGDPIACGSSYGKIRAMEDDHGNRVKEATPSTPVVILGLNAVPAAGETFVCCDSDKDAKQFAETYISEEKNRLIEETKAKMSLDDLFSQIQSGNMKELDIIVKADVQGSVEAVKQSLEKLSNEEVVVKVIHGGVGAINESDVILASASNAIIIGFNVRLDPMAKATADHEGVDVRLYKVIYNAIEDVEAAMKGMLDPVFEEKVIGHAEVRMTFKASGVGTIAGSYVTDGIIKRGCMVRISREGSLIFEGNLASLKRFKDDVKEVKSNYECGLVFEGFNDLQEMDQVEAYEMVEVPR